MSFDGRAGRGDRLQALLGGLEGLTTEVSREELPLIFAGLERVRRVAELRLVPTVGSAHEGLRPLLTAKQVADLLVVSTAEAYRLAKGALRSAAIEVGDGTLRFDPRRVERFLESRRRG